MRQIWIGKKIIIIQILPHSVGRLIVVIEKHRASHLDLSLFFANISNGDQADKSTKGHI
jgi:hypothetical protein